MTEPDNRAKTIAKNTLFLYFRMLFLMLISLFTGRVVLDALGVEDYGIYNIVGGFVALFSIVSSSLSSANSRFLNIEIGKGRSENLKVTFSTCVTVQYALAAIIAILCETIGIWYLNNIMVLPPERLLAARWCFQISVINFCTKLVTVPYNAAIIAHEKMKAFAYMSILEGVAKLAICSLIMAAPFDRLVFYALLMLFVQVIIRLLYRLYCHRHFEECHYHFCRDKELLKQVFSYSGWHLLGNSASILKNHGINLVLNLFFGPTVNAAKGVANQLQGAVSGFSKNFITAVRPQITQSYARSEYDYMMKLVFKGARLSYFLLFFLSLPVIVNANFIMQLWLKEVPEYSVIFCQLSFILILIESFSQTLITAQNATGNVRNYQIVVGGILLLNVPVSYLCMKAGMEPYSVALVTIIIECFCLAARMKMITVEAFNPKEYAGQVIGRCTAVSLLSSVIPVTLLFLLPVNFWSFLLNCVVCLLCSGLLILFAGCDISDRKFIFDKVKKAIGKFHNRNKL